VQFTWDPDKAARKIAKHGVSFGEARTAFADFFSITSPDPDHSATELRWITIGESSRCRLLSVLHTDRGDVIRIISARPVTRSERRIYEEG